MKKGRKKSLLAVSAITLALIVLIGGTIAWLSDARKVDNLLGVATDGTGRKLVQIIVDEPAFVKQLTTKTKDEIVTGTATEYTETVKDPNNANVTLASATYTKVTDDLYTLTEAKKNRILPGDKLKKDPTVTSVGETSVTIRAKAMIGTDNAFDYTLDAAKTGDPAIPLGLKVADGWKLVEDGNGNYWYYYIGASTDKLAEVVKDTSLGLFKDAGSDVTIEIPSGTKLAQDGGNLDIKVEFQAVQYTNFAENIVVSGTGVDLWADANIASASIG